MCACAALAVLALACCSSRTTAAPDPAAGSPVAEPVTAAATDSGAVMRFGVNGGMYPGIDAGADRIRQVTRELDELGPVWLRNAGRDMAWFDMQPTRDVWDFSKFDAVMEGNDHPWVFMLYRWDAYPFDGFSARAMQESGNKRAMVKEISDHQVDLARAEHRADAEVYIKKVVERYKDRIHHWEVGAEGLRSPGRLEFIRHTYGWVKEADPDAQVLVTAVAGDSEAMFDRNMDALDKLLEGGAGDHFDLGNIHYYGLTGDDLEERIERRFGEYRALLDRHGVDAPIWVTETGTSSHADSRLSGKSSERAQARDVVRRLVVFAAVGAERVIWHNYRVTSPADHFHECNLISARGGPKPAYHAYVNLVSRIGRFERVEALRTDDVRVYRFHDAGGDAVTVAWARTEGEVDLTGLLGTDPLARTEIIVEGGGAATQATVPPGAVLLGPDPVFLEPGT